MAEMYDFPPALVELRAELLDASEAWAAADSQASATAAYQRVHDLTMRLHHDEWLREAGNTHSVRTALREAAKARRAERGS